jgi:hypothetical protein
MEGLGESKKPTISAGKKVKGKGAPVLNSFPNRP